MRQNGRKNHGLSAEAQKARNAYLREWRHKNPQKVKDAQERYWERIAQRQKEYAQEQAAAERG